MRASLSCLSWVNCFQLQWYCILILVACCVETQEGRGEWKCKNLAGCWACSSGSHTKLTYIRDILNRQSTLHKRNVTSLLNMVCDGSTLREAILQKIPEFHEILSKNGDPPRPYCFYEILIQIFYRKFCDRIKIQQNSVNHHQSHPKFKFSMILVQWTPKIWRKLSLDEWISEKWMVWQA